MSIASVRADIAIETETVTVRIMKNIFWIIFVVIIVGGGIYFWKRGYSSTPSSSTNNSTSSSTNTANSTAISIENMAFMSADITVNKGTKVTWTNNDSVSHTVTANDGSFNSATIKNGENFNHVFDQTGTFTYHCTIHPSMKGTVTVTEI